MLVKALAIQSEDPALCELIQATQANIANFCRLHFLPFPANLDRSKDIKQIKRQNLLLTGDGKGPYREVSVERGVDIGGWSWDVKIADFNNDQWQDLYVTNGTWVPNEVTPSNLYFVNDGSGKFEEQSGPAGNEDYLITAGATVFDMDNDGDLDMITVPVNGPLAVFRNNLQAGNAISFEFADHAGNRMGIGNRIEIYYGENDDLKQMREVQLGGGFQSFDAPVAYFGLGDHEQVNRVKIYWSTGEATEITGPISTGNRYLVSRRSLEN